jgi:hypothetical protein
MPNAFFHDAFVRAAFAVVVFMATGAGARDLHTKPACDMTYAQVVTIGHSVVAANPDATFTDYDGDQAKKLVDKMNAVEPVSHWTAQHIVVIDPGDGEAFRVGIVDQDCVTHAFPVPREIWPVIVSDALGDAS